jgi:hypothetical protein
MGKNKCSSKELKSQIEQLESMVQVLKGQMKKDSSKVYRFTEEQMNDVTSSLFDKFLNYVSNQIPEIGIDESIVEIAIDDLTIVPSIDSYALAEEITSNISIPEEDEISEMLSETLSELDIEQPEEVEGDNN